MQFLLLSFVVALSLVAKGTSRILVGKEDVYPTPIKPMDPDTCGILDVYPCEAEGWVFCFNAVCEDDPISDPAKYGGKPFNRCQCWQPTSTNSSILPIGRAGTNCVLDLPDFPRGGKPMCDAMKAGTLISTSSRYGTPRDYPSMQYKAETAICLPKTPFTLCWGAPCYKTSESPTGIFCDCSYQFTDNEADQQISLPGPSECIGAPVNPCQYTHASMAAGLSPNGALNGGSCYTEPGAGESTCVECCNDPGPPTPPGPPPNKSKAPKNSF